jgi:hypothetical protein
MWGMPGQKEPRVYPRQDNLREQGHGFHVSLSLILLVLCGHLALQTLILILSSSFLWPIFQTTLIN